MAQDRQPVGKRPPHKHTPRRLLGARQLAQLVNAGASGGPTTARDRAILALLTTTGLRAQELCALSLDQLHKGFLTVCTAKQGEGRETYRREVPLPHETALHLRAYLAEAPRPCREEEQALFLTYDGYPLDRRTLAQIVQGAAERAQLAEHHVTVALIRFSVGALRLGVYRGQQDGQDRSEDTPC